MSAILLNAGAADFVVGGCGTGQGYLNAVLQYPNVVCGLISGPLDAWLFTQINGGNCISLPLNQGYGWAADANLRFVFDRIFSVERGCGYPESRKESQQQSRAILEGISQAAGNCDAGREFSGIFGRSGSGGKREIREVHRSITRNDYE